MSDPTDCPWIEPLTEARALLEQAMGKFRDAATVAQARRYERLPKLLSMKKEIGWVVHDLDGVLNNAQTKRPGGLPGLL